MQEQFEAEALDLLNKLFTHDYTWGSKEHLASHRRIKLLDMENTYYNITKMLNRKLTDYRLGCTQLAFEKKYPSPINIFTDLCKSHTDCSVAYVWRFFRHMLIVPISYCDLSILEVQVDN